MVYGIAASGTLQLHVPPGPSVGATTPLCSTSSMPEETGFRNRLGSASRGRSAMIPDLVTRPAPVRRLRRGAPRPAGLCRGSALHRHRAQGQRHPRPLRAPAMGLAQEDDRGRHRQVTLGDVTLAKKTIVSHSNQSHPKAKQGELGPIPLDYGDSPGGCGARCFRGWPYSWRRFLSS